MIINDVYKEINEITSKLIKEGLSIQQNFPNQRDLMVSWSGESNISNALRNISYLEKYRILEESKAYNIKMLDGALIQFQYSFSKKGGKLKSHRLAYYPSPKLERYEDAPDDYEKRYFGNSEYHDIFEEFSVTFPIRFDFDNDAEKFIPVNHPYCHAHLGEHENCRIPISSPISPSEFINFILLNFYNTAIKEYCNNLHFGIRQKFDYSIDPKELKILHFHRS